MLNIRNRNEHIWTHTEWVKYKSMTYVSRSAASTSTQFFLFKKAPFISSFKFISIMLTKSALFTVLLSATQTTQRTQDTEWSISRYPKKKKKTGTLSEHHISLWLLDVRSWFENKLPRLEKDIHKTSVNYFTQIQVIWRLHVTTSKRFVNSHRHRTCCILLKLSDSGQRYWRVQVKDVNQQ